ncbi:MAG: hypothetical protein ACM37W_24715 [Actinomycetota bacterium]
MEFSIYFPLPLIPFATTLVPEKKPRRQTRQISELEILMKIA